MKYITANLLIFFLLGCQFHTEPLGYPALRGVVTDASGVPVKDALIEIEYRSDPAGLFRLPVESHDDNITATINFTVPHSTHMLLWISRFQRHDTVKTLIDQHLSAGKHSVVWDGTDHEGKQIISDVYEYHLEFGEEIITGEIFLINRYDDIQDFENIEYYAKTDQSGAFSIHTHQLACNYDVHLTYVDEQGQHLGSFQISRYIKIWALHEALGKTFLDDVYVDPDDPVAVKLIY